MFYYLYTGYFVKHEIGNWFICKNDCCIRILNDAIRS